MHNDPNLSLNGVGLLRPLANLSDEELMVRLATGDDEALTPLHARYAGLVFGLVAQSLDRPAAEEITQDVFFTVWQKAHTYDLARGHVRPWLLQIARSRMFNELRRRGRRPRLVFELEETQIGSIADDGPLPDEQVYRDDRRTLLMEAIAALPPAQRQALSLAYFHDLTQQQVATQLGVPLGTAKTWIRAGTQRLRSTLAPVAASALAIGGLVAIGTDLHQGAPQRFDRQPDAASSSKATVVRLTAAPGVSGETYGTYQTQPGADLALMTFSHFAPAPPGTVHQIWVSQDGIWRALGTVPLDANGEALVIIDQPEATALEALQVTVEPLAGSEIPTGPVVVAWSSF